MQRKKQMGFATDALLYHRKSGYMRLPMIIDQVLSAGAPEIRVKLLLSETPLTKVMSDYRRGKKFLFKKILGGRDEGSGFITGQFGRKIVRTIEGSFHVLQHPVYKIVWLVITDAGKEFLEKPFAQFLKTIHPRPSRPILRTSQIEELLLSLQSIDTIQNIRITEIGQRAHITSRGATKDIESDRRWTDLEIREAFTEANVAGQWITDVLAEYSLGLSRFSSVKITRDGEFIFHRPGSRFLFHAFVDRAAEMAKTRYDFLKNRARTKENHFQSKPFVIDFKGSVFESKEQIAKLHEVLSNIPSTTCTRLHSNPYYHVTMVDYSDGSSYEILVLSDNEINVLPQGRSTVRSLQRLCAHIFSNIREGDLKEHVSEHSFT